MSIEYGVRIGDFRLEKQLGAGGMGIVYQALQLSLNRVVALKVLGGSLHRQEDIARFRREAQAVAKLNHPFIASVYFVGQDQYICYMAIEYIDGMPLRSLIDRLVARSDPASGIDSILEETEPAESAAESIRFDELEARNSQQPVPDPSRGGTVMIPTKDYRPQCTPEHVRRCCEIVRDVALALAHAHERGVIHRDIKPENLMIDRQGKPHIIDFGVARFYEDMTLTNTGALVGTPMYMSPEQITGRIKLDHRTDIFSLGLVLYEMLTLRRPISASTREGVLRQIATKEIEPITRENRVCPPVPGSGGSPSGCKRP